MRIILCPCIAACLPVAGVLVVRFKQSPNSDQVDLNQISSDIAPNYYALSNFLKEKVSSAIAVSSVSAIA